MNALNASLSSLALALAALPGPAAAQEHTAPRSARVDARGASVVRVEARAGTLRIEGRPGISEVRVTGTARASRRNYLQEIRLVAERHGDEVYVAVEIPERTVFFGSLVRALDLVVEVPERMALDVTDSSGEAEVRRVASLRLDDSSGDVEITDVAGALRVEDNSGELRIERVGGDVRVTDSSGDVRVRDVRGGVVIEDDSSGDIEVREVGRDVLVREDSSGDIRVDGIGGSFTVSRDGSGEVQVGKVAGEVRVPRRR